MRTFTRPVVLLAFVALLASADVAEAGPFDGLLKGVVGKIKGAIENVFEETAKKISVLSGVFGEGVTRGDLSLPKIINGAFSRNNGVWVANSPTNADWELGDGTTIVAGFSNGGAVGIVTNNGTVTITTGTQSKPQEEEDDEKKEEKKEQKKCKKGKKGKKCRKEKREQAAKEQAEKEAAEQAEKEITPATFEGSDLDEAFSNLLSDWQTFVTSSIWDVQEPDQEPDPTANPESEEMELETNSHVINGVFFGNGVASGSSFAVKFFYNNEENFYCSGSLIGYPYALTAGHCGVVEGDEVRVGGRLLRSGYQAQVANVFYHPDFEAGSLVHDVAIVRLQGLADKDTLMENGVKAARINKRVNFPKAGFVGVLSGHGSVETDGKSVSDELRTTRQTVLDTDVCREQITQGDLGDDDSYLCAGDGERSTTCVGDSGAGLWHYRVKERENGKTRKFYEIFGIVSFGEVTDEALCPRGPPTVFQSTAASYDWIVEVIGKENMP